MLIVLTWDELVLVWMRDRLLPPHRTCRAHTRPPERKSGDHSLWRIPHFPLLPPFLQLSSFSSFPLNFGHQSVQKKLNNNISCFQNLRLCIQTWTNIFKKSFKWIPYFVHSQSMFFLLLHFLHSIPIKFTSVMWRQFSQFQR